MDTPGSANRLAGTRIGVFGRGGSGKSTLTVLLARALAARGYPTCVLDADSTNVGLAAALGVVPRPHSLIDYFGGMVFRGGRVTCPVDDPSRLEDAEIDLEKLPAEFVRRSPEGVALMEAGKLASHGVGAGCDGPIGKIARDLRLTGAARSPVLVVDHKAGFEDVARGLITGMDWAIGVVDPTQASIQLAGDLSRTVDHLHDGALPATAHLDNPEWIEIANAAYRESPLRGVRFVLSRVPDETVDRFLTDSLSRMGLAVSGRLPFDSAIQTAWMQGAPVTSSAGAVAAADIVLSLEAATAEPPAVQKGAAP